MIIQRKVSYDRALGGTHGIFWEDVITEEAPTDVLAFLKSLNDPVGTEYRIIFNEECNAAIVTQPSKKEVEWLESK